MFEKCFDLIYRKGPGALHTKTIYIYIYIYTYEKCFALYIEALGPYILNQYTFQTCIALKCRGGPGAQHIKTTHF